MLEAENLETGYGPMQILWGITIKAEKQSITTIIGPNGAGKTTILRAIMGMIQPWNGKITYDGDDVTMLPPHKKVERGLSMVLEGRHLFGGMTVKENLILGAYTKQARERLDDSLEIVYTLFPILKERSTQKAGTLSGGQQQMLAIARALMTRPKLIMLDEPSQGLAPIVVEQVMDTLKKLREELEITILLVEQNVLVSYHTADYTYIIENGQVVKEGEPSECIDIQEIRKAYLGV
jgi:branched-chain amino acid transport system ATP-binding protein